MIKKNGDKGVSFNLLINKIIYWIYNFLLMLYKFQNHCVNKNFSIFFIRKNIKYSYLYLFIIINEKYYKILN
jgi:hypothetical protein